jgi:aminoglycoside phosphotransferase (APT) family kinase protein
MRAMDTTSDQIHEGETEVVQAWIETNIGPVVSIERQQRWRAAWYVSVGGGDGDSELYVRGNRAMVGDGMSVTMEAEILSALNGAGVRVPKIYGYIAEVDAIVMNALPGQANLENAVDDAERTSVMRDYMETLAKVHAIPKSTFASLGFEVPQNAEDVALAYFYRFEKMYRKTKRRPEPVIEFVVRWVRRSFPRQRAEAHFVLGDPGQFMFKDGKITGVLDILA